MLHTVQCWVQRQERRHRGEKVARDATNALLVQGMIGSGPHLPEHTDQNKQCGS